MYDVFFDLQILKRTVVTTNIPGNTVILKKKYFASILHSVTSLSKCQRNRNSKLLKLFHLTTTVLLLIAMICLEGQKFVKELQQTVVPKYDCAKAKV